MEKEFVPYELAVKLKALGFDEPCFGWYEHNSNFYYCYQEGLVPPSPSKKLIKGCCLAPTFSQAFRFFREKYGLLHDITLTTNVDDKLVGFYMLIHKMNDDLVVDEDDDVEVEVMTTDKYEAELACIDKLIEIVEKK